MYFTNGNFTPSKSLEKLILAHPSALMMRKGFSKECAEKYVDKACHFWPYTEKLQKRVLGVEQINKLDRLT